MTEYTASGSREWIGSLGSLSPVETLDRAYFLYSYVGVTHNIWTALHCETSGTCTWTAEGLPIFPSWDDLVCEVREYPEPNGITQEDIYHAGEQNFTAALHGVWDYDGIPRAAWVDQVETRVFHAEVLDVHPPFTETASWRYEVRTTGGVIGAQALSMYTNYLAGTGFLEPRLMALDPDTLALHIWWTREDPGGLAVYRTIGTGGLVLMPGIMDVAQVSRDGVDVIAYTSNRSAQVFSTDSGATWHPVPALGTTGALVPEHHFGAEFVDEVA